MELTLKLVIVKIRKSNWKQAAARALAAEDHKALIVCNSKM